MKVNFKNLPTGLVLIYALLLVTYKYTIKDAVDSIKALFLGVFKKQSFDDAIDKICTENNLNAKQSEELKQFINNRKL